MVIELLLTWHLGNLKKAEVVGIGFFERKNNVDEIPTQLRNIANPFALCCNSNHRLRGLESDVPNLPEFTDKKMEQAYGVL